MSHWNLLPPHLYRCLECDFTTYKRNQLGLHVARFHRHEYICKECGYFAGSISCLSGHIRAHHRSLFPPMSNPKSAKKLWETRKRRYGRTGLKDPIEHSRKMVITMLLRYPNHFKEMGRKVGLENVKKLKKGKISLLSVGHESAEHIDAKNCYKEILEEAGFKVTTERWINISGKLYRVDLFGRTSKRTVIVEIGGCKRKKLQVLARKYGFVLNLSKKLDVKCVAKLFENGSVLLFDHVLNFSWDEEVKEKKVE